MTRIKASLIHLAISSILACIVISLLIFGWYPLPYFSAIGGVKLLALIVGVDVVLGPLLTLIVFKPGKKSLRFDLTVIALIQAAALGYGLYTGATSRVVYGVFVSERFYLVNASEIDPEDMAKATLPEFREPPVFGPRFIAARIPEDKKLTSEYASSRVFGMFHKDLPEYYIPLDKALPTLAKVGIPKSVLVKKNPALVKAIEQVMASEKLDWSATSIIPFEVRSASYSALVDLRRGIVVKVLPYSAYGKNN